MNLQILTRRPRISGTRGGFTLIELVVVIMVAGVIAGFAIPSFANLGRNKAAQGARDSFVWLAAKARIRAIEMGTTWLLEVDPVNERAWIVRRNPTTAADTLQIVNYPTEHEVRISTASNNLITVCYNPRGFAWQCSNASPSANVDITFTTARRSATARLKPLGQVERL